MRKLFYCMLLIFMLLPYIQQNVLATEEKVMFYQIIYQTDNVKGRITINGFVVTEINGNGESGSAALNPWLIGNNEVKVEMKKADPSKPAGMTFGLSELVPGDIVSTTDKGNLFSVELKGKDFDSNGTASASRQFKSSLDFRHHLSDAGAAKQTDVLAYAQKIYHLFEKKDAEAIIRESEIKINDYSIAFGGADVKTGLYSYLTDELFKSKLSRIAPSALRAVAVGPTGRIWHIFNGKDELIQAKSPDGSTFELPVYVGLLDGKLKIVR